MVSTELILDLGKLYKKHGSDSFIELAEFLRNPKHIDDLILILGSASKFSKETSPAKLKQKTSSNQFPKSLEDLQYPIQINFDILNQFYQKLISKEALISVREIKFFREDNGLNSSKAKSHREAIISLIDDLTNLSLEKLKKIEVKSTNENNALQGWSEIILNRK